MYKLVVLFSVICASALACGPGSEESLAKLNKFLGLEIDLNGLDNTGYSEEYVEKASDLTCDFEDMTTCKWTNAPADDVLDHLEYFLFEKTSDKSWKRPQLRPGENPPVGNHVILAGDDSKDNKAAVWYSSPIECQLNTGSLTFSYWLFNGAKVEVVILKALTNPLQVLSRPTPQDCKHNRARGSQCVVLIPPQDEPFQIGIRVHHLTNLIGALGILDDIHYDAEICSDGTNLGRNFKAESLLAGRSGSFIETSSDLDCGQFDEACRWGNSPRGTKDWRRGTGAVDEAKWRDLTGVSTLPGMPFAFIEVAEGDSGAAGILYSDPIPCQVGSGTISFRYWLSPGVKLRVCTTALSTDTPLTCAAVSEFGSPGPISMPISGSINEEFVISFETVDFNRDKGGFAAIDDIEYDALLCTETTPAPRTTTKPPTTTARSPTDLGDDFTTGTLGSGLSGGFIDRASDLDCDYGDAGSCHWGNAGLDGETDWLLGNGPLDPDRMLELTGTRKVPDGSFAYIPFSSIASGSMDSDKMRCLRGEGQMTLRYWVSGGAELQVCAVETGGSFESEVFCETLQPENAPGPITINVPPIDEEFKMRISALGFSDGFAMVDDVEFRGDVCAEEPGVDDTVACQVLSCDFSLNRLCGYASSPIDSSSATFQLYNTTIGVAENVKVGKDNDYYLGTTLDHNSKMAVLVSPEFELGASRKLRFDYMRGTYGSELWLCRNNMDMSLDGCEKIAGPSLSVEEFRGLGDASLDVGPADKKLFIVARHTRFTSGRASFAVDNLRLTETDGTEMC